MPGPPGGPPRLKWPDYVVFVLMLMLSASIGIFHTFRSYRASKKRTGSAASAAATSDYLLGNRNMSFLPVTISLTVSYISAILFLGYPADTYAFGAQWWMFSIGITLGPLLAAVLYVPLLYPLKLTSINEYLMMRFESQTVKYIGMITSVSGLTLISAASFYAPATATAAVSGIPNWGSILLVSFISLLYTTLGGFRGVIWTDVFQAGIMLIGMLTVVIQAVSSVGDLTRIFQLNDEYDRLNFIVTDPDPTLRLNIWGLIIGAMFMYSGIYGTGQISVQRIAALPTLKQAMFSMMGMAPGLITLTLLACLCGTSIFAYYAQLGCDPLSSHKIRNPNQIMVFFAVDVLNAPGIPGLFMSAVWAGSLSSVSSALNSAAANLWQDLLKDKLPTASEVKVSRILKGLVVGFGVIATGLAFLMSKARSGTVVEIMGTFASAMIGPSKGLVILGGFFPWVNWIGASAGSAVSFIFGLWVAMGSVFHKQIPGRPPAPIHNCTHRMPPVLANLTTAALDTGLFTTASSPLPTPPSKPSGIYGLYSISFLWLPTICICINIVIAIVISFITGHTKPSSVPPKVLHPLTRWMLGYRSNSNSDDLDKHKNNSEVNHAYTNAAFPWRATARNGKQTAGDNDHVTSL